MNLHYRYASSNLDTRQMEESLLRLLEAYRRLDKDLISESLSVGKMSDFLFEADQEQVVVASAKEARDATMKNLDAMAEVGVQLNNSQAIATFVAELRKRLAKIVLDSGEFATLKDFAGITIKQISFIGNSLAKGMKSVDAAIDALVASLDTLKIDFRSSDLQGKTLEQMISSASQGLDVTALQAKDIDVDKFKKAIQQKMAEITGKGSTGLFSKIMNMIKGASIEPITMDGDRFADDLLGCTGKQIDDYLKGPAPSQADKDQVPGTAEISQLGKAAKVTPQNIEDAKPSGAPPAKLKAADLDSMDTDEMKSNINKTARAFGAKGDIIERHTLSNQSNVILSERWEKLAGIKECKR